MKLGISSYTYTWAIGWPGRSPPDPMGSRGLLGKALEQGLGLVQVADNLPLDRMNGDELNAFFLAAREQGVALEVGARGMTEANLERYIRIAGLTQSRLLRFVIDGPDFSPDVPAILGIISNALPVLKKENMVLALENHERLKAADFAGIVEKIGSDHVGICLDTVNSLGAGEGLDAVVELLGPMTVNLHVKDYRIKRLDHQMGFVVEGCPAGDGMLDLPRILERLGDRCRSAVLEQWTPAAENLAGTIAREAAWAKKSISYLKKWIK